MTETVGVLARIQAKGDPRDGQTSGGPAHREGVDMANATRLCSEDGCSNKSLSRGFCHRHYRLDHLDASARADFERQFWAKVDCSGSCWIWLAARNEKGYGIFRWASAHRLAYELVVGPIPAGLQIDHLCMVTSCVNPAHLEPVTGAENQRRAAVARTHCRHGHEFTPENTYVNRRGARECRTCTRVAATGAYRRKHAPHLIGRNPSLPQTHCKRGHEFTSENTQVYTAPNGKTRRICQACLKARNQAWYQAHKKGAA